MTTISQNQLDQSISYAAYHQLMAELVQHQNTAEYSESLINYTRMNIIRMERLDKTTKIQPDTQGAMEKIDRRVHLLILTEPWCGDAAQIIPVFQKMVSINPNLSLSCLLRDQNLDLIDQYLTDDARSIPMTLILDPTAGYQVLGHWGPRPFIAHGMMMKGLAEWRTMPAGEAKDLFHRDLYTKLQKWYARDKTRSIQDEFTAYLQEVI